MDSSCLILIFYYCLTICKSLNPKVRGACDNKLVFLHAISPYLNIFPSKRFLPM